MRLFLCALLLAVPSGCARYEIEPPLISYASTLESVTPLQIEAEELPKRPTVRLLAVQGTNWAAFSPEGMIALAEFVDVAERNTDVLHEVLLANNSLIEERNNLVILAKEIQKRSNALAVEWANTEEQKRKAEDLRTIETTVYRVLILIGLSLAL